MPTHNSPTSFLSALQQPKLATHSVLQKETERRREKDTDRGGKKANRKTETSKEKQIEEKKMRE